MIWYSTGTLLGVRAVEIADGAKVFVLFCGGSETRAATKRWIQEQKSNVRNQMTPRYVCSCSRMRGAGFKSLRVQGIWSHDNVTNRVS